MPKTVTVTKEQTSRRPLLDYAGAAEYLGFTEKFMRRLVKEKRVPYVKMGPSKTSRVYFDPDVLDTWVESNTVPADA
jgi:excisionase family DNA binding protein